MRLLTIILFSLGSLFSYGQCCPYIDSVEITPTTPNDNTETIVITTVTTPNLGSFINSSYTIDALNITIVACYYSGEATALQTYTDTINLGILPSGDYNLLFNANQIDDNSTTCENGNFQTQTYNSQFTVEVANSISINHSVSSLQLYPNPAINTISILSEKNIDVVQIFDISGKMLLSSSSNTNSTDIDISDLDTGVYLVKIFMNDGSIYLEELVKTRDQ